MNSFVLELRGGLQLTILFGSICVDIFGISHLYANEFM